MFTRDGFFETFGSERVYVIDHHESNPAWGTNNYIDPRAAASAVIVFQIAKQLGQIVGPEVATLLFAGLMDDTGSWRFSNSNGQSFLVAASLVAAGASPEEVANAIYFSVPEKVIKLRSMALGTLQTHCDGAVASIAVTRQMLEACDATIEDSDGIVDIARSLQGVRCAVFMREREQGWRVSLRAKDSSIDVNQVAGVFSGGGHPAAAGATIPSGSLESAIDSVIEVISKQL